LAVRLTECFLFIFAASRMVRFAPQANYLIWVANGVLLAYPLLAPRQRWPAYLAAAFAAQTASSLLAASTWRMNLLFTVLSLLEVSLARCFSATAEGDFRASPTYPTCSGSLLMGS
jgi:integral membrane sensor domain MASE1